MADCAALRPDLLAYHDGEASHPERERIEAHLHTCQNCRDDLSRAAWEVGLFLLNLPTSANAVGPSAGFADRVMQSVRATPRAAAPGATSPKASPAPSAPSAAPSGPSAPYSPSSPPVHLLPPASPVARVLPWRTWATAAAFAATAAAVAFVFLNGEPTPVPTPHLTNPEGMGSVVARNGGALRWNDRAAFDRGLAGSAWSAKGEAVPTLPGGYLHSPAPSSVRVRLPGGGQFDAGPSSWLSFPEDLAEGGAVALLDGALTATAPTGPVGPAPGSNPGPGSGPALFAFEAPGIRVESSGAVEMSVRVEGGAKAAASWFAARAEALLAGTAIPAPPRSTVLVYAREGPAVVASAAGPVRNSLERHTLEKGQALILSEDRIYLQRGVDDDAPPEGVAGLSVPPDSLYFAGAQAFQGDAMQPSGGGNTLMASGPVRNSLERTLGDASSDPEARADALTLFDSVGGMEAIDAAVKAVDDPAIQVRCAALRILALNSEVDRPRALAALRRLAVDVDSGVAVFAIRALDALRDREAIPMLRTLVVDDDAPPEEVQVAAFEALVNMGDTSRLPEAAGRLGRMDPASIVGTSLQATVNSAFERLPIEQAIKFLSDSRPGVLTAALIATRDQEAARQALSNPSTQVQVAGVEVLLNATPDMDLELFRPLHGVDSKDTKVLILRIAKCSLVRQIPDIPRWILDGAQAILEDSTSTQTDCYLAALLLRAPHPEGLFERLLSSGTLSQRTALNMLTDLPPSLFTRSLIDSSAAVRSLAIASIAKYSVLPEESLPSADFLPALTSFAPASNEDGRHLAAALSNLARLRNHPVAFQLLVQMATSDNLHTRRGAAYGLGPLCSRPEAAEALYSLLQNSDSVAAEAAVEQVTHAVRRNRWSGRPVVEMFPCMAPNTVVRAHIAHVARRLGVAGAAESFVRELDGATPATRAAILKKAIDFDYLLDFPLPSLVRDPSALVRLRLLLATTGPSRASMARLLVDDPVFWVQAHALSILSSEGDAAAYEALRVLVREQVDANDSGDKFLGGLDPDSSELAGHVSLSARLASEFGSVVDRLADPASNTSNEALIVTARARALCHVLRGTAASAERVAAANLLGDCHVQQALVTLAFVSDPSRASGQAELDAARISMTKLLGYPLTQDPVAWVKLHFRGYVSIMEIQAHAKN